jgi:hypothetical protein
MGRQGVRAGLPAQADVAYELAIPHPSQAIRKLGHEGAVRQPEGAALAQQLGDEGGWILPDLGKLRRAHILDVIGRPAATESFGVGR